MRELFACIGIFGVFIVVLLIGAIIVYWTCGYMSGWYGWHDKSFMEFICFVLVISSLTSNSSSSD